MKKFFGYFFASLLAGLVLFFIAFVVITSVISSIGKEVEERVRDQSVLKINLDGPIEEFMEENPFTKILGEIEPSDLRTLQNAIKKAAKDDKIKGIYLNVGMLGSSGWASIEALRNELLEFKKSKKFIYAYGEVYSKKMYYLCTAADQIFVYPTGLIEWNGLSSNPMFYKGTLQKLEIEPKVFRVGTFKSAVEPFILDKMSEANRLQVQTFLNDFWNHIKENVAKARKISVQELQRYADEITIQTVEDALRYKLIDGIKFQDQVLELLREKSGLGKEEKVRFVNAINYGKNYKPKTSSNKIAVIYAVGNIVSGKSGDGSVGSETFVNAVREARLDKNVKAIVIRVNSPGGSALASDVMAREIELAKKDKPVYASYGDVAASGGYYISAGCQKIFAEPTTITGSIGVFGLLLNTQKMFNNKLGITFDRVTTSQYADLGDPNRPMSEYEAKTIQKSVNKIYGDFINVVKKGRNFPDSLAVDSIAQGRVWSGIRAKQIGLVDEIGGLDDAIQKIAKAAGLGDDYQLVIYPEQPSFLEKFFKLDNKTNLAQQYLNAEQYQIYKQLKIFARDKSGIYMLEPYEYDVK